MDYIVSSDLKVLNHDITAYTLQITYLNNYTLTNFLTNNIIPIYQYHISCNNINLIKLLNYYPDPGNSGNSNIIIDENTFINSDNINIMNTNNFHLLFVNEDCSQRNCHKNYSYFAALYNWN